MARTRRPAARIAIADQSGVAERAERPICVHRDDAGNQVGEVGALVAEAGDIDDLVEHLPEEEQPDHRLDHAHRKDHRLGCDDVDALDGGGALVRYGEGGENLDRGGLAAR